MDSLEEKLKKLIADEHGITPEEVTPEFIMQQRDILWHRPDFGFIDGDPGLEYQTVLEAEEEQRRAGEFLNKILQGKER